MWYRVFGLTDAEISPAALLEHLHTPAGPVQGHFRGDESGWFEAQLVLENYPLLLGRYLVSEEGIRAELNSWAAWIELQEGHPQQGHLMQQIISTRQVFTVELAGERAKLEPLQNLCQQLCQFLAGQTQGYYQIDGQGLFDAAGTLLLRE